ncbi:phospholipid carrier-dependent glycosyltransferase [bacterium]|nr:phospholipid carrier-dependent glycosyltransferase [bacterium]
MKKALALALPAALALALAVPGMSRESFPCLHGALYPDYPPLYFWIALAGAKASGRVGAFAVRLPSAIGAALVALAASLLGTRLASSRVGLRAGLLTAVLPGLWYEETRAMIDPLFVGWTTLAVALLAQSTGESESLAPRAARIAGGVLALACAWLTKGPLGAVLVLLALAGGEGLVLALSPAPDSRVRGSERGRAAVLAMGRFLALFMFFSIAKPKRSYYLMPAYPAVGLLAACFFERASGRIAAARETILRALAMLLLLVALLAPAAGAFDRDLVANGLGLSLAALLGAASLFLFSRTRPALALVAASAFLLAGAGAAAIPEVEKHQSHHAYHGFAERIFATGVPREGIAVTPGGAHREALCWELAPVTTGLVNLLAAEPGSRTPDRSTVLYFLRASPPRRTAVILGKEHLGIFEAALRKDLEVVADSAPDESGGMLAIERKE